MSGYCLCHTVKCFKSIWAMVLVVFISVRNATVTLKFFSINKLFLAHGLIDVQFVQALKKIVFRHTMSPAPFSFILPRVLEGYLFV